MDRLISLEPSNLVAIRIEPSGQKCSGELTLRNVMYTMPVAFRIQAMNKSRYTIKPQTGIISPLSTLTIEITYHLPPGFLLPEKFPLSEDMFLLHSVVVPGASIKDSTTNFDAVPPDWFTARKKQVFIDSGIKTMFVGSSVLAQLVADGLMDEIRQVLERSDPSWNPADSMDSNGLTLLHIAIAQARPDIVQLLLEFGPDVELQSRGGSSPLEAASGAGEALIVELLLAHRASVERSEASNWGPVHLAAAGGHLEVLRLLLLKGGNVDSVAKDGYTALHLAVEEHRRDCARLLLASGAKPNIRDGTKGDTPLHIAARIGDENMIRLLLQKGANKNIRNRSGKIAFDIATEYGHSRLFDALKLGDSLCSAARKGEVRNILKLIESGASINGKDQHGWTALHRAGFKGKIEAVRMLVERGIDVNAKDEDGYTALHCATESGHADVIELLVKKGADVEARTNKGVTALQIAESLHYVGITRVLVHSGASKDGVTQVLSSHMIPYGKTMVGNEVEKPVKKRSNRARALRSSFDRSMPVAVL
ncbi:Protein VAPYRIN [Euphorbia peplus]|nr:Protein VAPYRIN [Euphorbia peplus]